MLEKILSLLEVSVEFSGSNIILSLVAIVGGFALIVWGIINMVTVSKKKKTYILTNAKVIDYAVHRNSDGHNTYGVIGEYLVNGVNYTINPRSYSNTTKTKYPLGSLVKVRYNPENPEDAIFDKDGSAVFVLIGGVIFFIVGIAMLISK